MHPLLFSITQVELIWANLNGGMDCLPDLANITTCIRLSLNKKSELCRAITQDNSADFQVTNSPDAERLLQTINVIPRANFLFDFPALESSESLAGHFQVARSDRPGESHRYHWLRRSWSMGKFKDSVGDGSEGRVHHWRMYRDGVDDGLHQALQWLTSKWFSLRWLGW